MIVNICGIPHKVIECEDNFNVDTHSTMRMVACRYTKEMNR